MSGVYGGRVNRKTGRESQVFELTTVEQVVVTYDLRYSVFSDILLCVINIH